MVLVIFGYAGYDPANWKIIHRLTKKKDPQECEGWAGAANETLCAIK
jgi:hypothetical protein